LQHSETSDYLLGVCFTDNDNGTVVGDNGIILRTTNSGVTWNTQKSGITHRLRGVSFVDSYIGTAVGGENYFEGIIL